VIKQCNQISDNMTDGATQRKIYIGYCRVSTYLQVVKGVSLEEQKEEIRKWCEANNADVEFVVDEGMSGRARREKYEQALNKVLTGTAPDGRQYTGLVGISLSRIGRDAIKLREDVDKLDKAGKQLVLIREGGILDRSTAASRLVFNILADFAEYELENIRERLYNGFRYVVDHPEELKRRGKKPIGRPRKQIPPEALKELKLGVPKAEIIRKYHLSHNVVYRVAKELGL